LGNEIKQINKKIKELETISERVTSNGFDGMPRGSGISDKVGNGAVGLADYKARLQVNKEKYWNEINRLMAFIETVNDSETRQIISLKYINNFTFQQIAFAIGSYDESVPRKKLKIFLTQSEKSDEEKL
jgi:hypothetical protein